MYLCFSGYSSVGSALSGPGKVSGPEWGSLTVQCHYDSGWESYRKWWCRGAHWSSCKIVIVTSGSEDEVKIDHLSIRDSHKDLRFTVTMEDLRKDDADTYWCGIERSGTDLGVQVKVIITPGYSTTRNPVTIPETTSGPELDSSTMQCSYDQEWETYGKRWCQGADMDRCRMELKRDNADTCWCRLKINGIECAVEVKVDTDPREPTLPRSRASHASVLTVPQWSLGQRTVSPEVLLCFVVLAMV
ncbi:CMRF35-like molecule 4 [Otolemur garnettii]|uniref:CMRF35-like molecule 4 n=1 Tax=Otolemur garnettii TaxID=30611 RepID=UPI000C7F4BAD|nr:CMRF35-like molecule 4 [Otolemur garnettii]